MNEPGNPNTNDGNEPATTGRVVSMIPRARKGPKAKTGKSTAGKSTAGKTIKAAVKSGVAKAAKGVKSAKGKTARKSKGPRGSKVSKDSKSSRRVDRLIVRLIPSTAFSGIAEAAATSGVPAKYIRGVIEREYIAYVRGALNQIGGGSVPGINPEEIAAAVLKERLSGLKNRVDAETETT